MSFISPSRHSMRVDCGTLKRREAPGPGNLPPTLSNSLDPWPRTVFMSKTVRLFLQQTQAKLRLRTELGLLQCLQQA